MHKKIISATMPIVDANTSRNPQFYKDTSFHKVSLRIKDPKIEYIKPTNPGLPKSRSCSRSPQRAKSAYRHRRKHGGKRRGVYKTKFTKVMGPAAVYGELPRGTLDVLSAS